MPAIRPTRDQYVHWEQMTTRWADIDVYGHMNNARYFELIDTVVNNHMDRALGVDIRTLPHVCLLYTSPSPRDGLLSRMPSSA